MWNVIIKLWWLLIIGVNTWRWHPLIGDVLFVLRVDILGKLSGDVLGSSHWVDSAIEYLFRDIFCKKSVHGELAITWALLTLLRRGSHWPYSSNNLGCELICHRILPSLLYILYVGIFIARGASGPVHCSPILHGAAAFGPNKAPEKFLLHFPAFLTIVPFVTLNNNYRFYSNLLSRPRNSWRSSIRINLWITGVPAKYCDGSWSFFKYCKNNILSRRNNMELLLFKFEFFSL